MSYLTEAFKALDALNEDTFSVSDDGIKKLAEFEDNDDFVDEITVYDADAEDTEDLDDSYVGKVIVDCNVCHSKIYKDKSDVVIDEETQNANIDEECPYCYSTDGFKVIGEVAPMTTETEEKVKVEDELEESLNEATTLQFTDDYEYDTLSAIEDDNITLFNKLKNYPELIKGDEVIIPKGTKLVYDRTDEYYKYYKLPEYGNLRIRILADEYTDFSHHIGTSDETFAKYVDKLNSGVRKFSVKWADVKDFEKYLNDHDISYDTGYGGKASVPFIIKSKVTNESLNEATVTDYKGSLSNILVKNQDKISKMSTKGEIVKFLDSITDEVRDKNYLETVKRNMQKKNDFGALQYIYGIILSGEGKGVKESLEENIGTDIDEYQQWVDYDMKRYGKISDQTNKEIKEAGLQVVKDKYGDYQVIAGKYDESLKESVKNESLEEVEVETGDTKVEISSDEDGKITVSSEPCESEETPEDNAEAIKPISDETEAEIEANDSEEDIDIEDFDEESFDELGEGYFKNVYENVNSFKASNITTKGNKVIVEGVITFDNNVKKNTSFLFESANKTKNGKYRFIGENLNVTKGNKAFSLIGNVTDKKFLSESMNYNYRTKNDIGKFIRCCGTIKRG